MLDAIVVALEYRIVRWTVYALWFGVLAGLALYRAEGMVCR